MCSVFGCWQLITAQRVIGQTGCPKEPWEKSWGAGNEQWPLQSTQALCVCYGVYLTVSLFTTPTHCVARFTFCAFGAGRNYDAMWKFLVFTLRYFMGIWGVAVISAGFVRMLNGCRSESSLSSECNDTASLICPFSLWKPFKVPWSALRRATWRSGGYTVTIFTIICGCIEKYHKACFSLLTGRY